jgi:crotonobetainyl-CoA:carnitine CoA-transferase CaiB-like acyl-CoA transferase
VTRPPDPGPFDHDTADHGTVVPPATGPLAGLRVLDLTSVIMGPFATQILGDLGADVVSVEDIGGDTNRVMGPGPHPQLSGTSLNLLRNKRNVSLDLKRPEGREAFLRLAETADVVVTNLRPGPLGRLGLDYERVRARRPDVIFCTAHGWPSDHPRANAPAYDDIVQAATGIADVLGRANGRPMLMPSIIADKVSGLTIAYAVLAALHHRDRTGEGQHVEVPMVDAVRAFMLVEHGSAGVSEPPLGPPGYNRILTPHRRPQQTTDGFVNVLPYSQNHYEDLFVAGGRADLVGDDRIRSGRSRIANADSLYQDVAAVIATNTTSHWLAFCDEHGIPASKVVTLDELLAELPVVEHPVAGRYRQTPLPVRFSATPSNVRRHAPLIGEHGDEVLGEVGYDEDELTMLRDVGALRRR